MRYLAKKTRPDQASNDLRFFESSEESMFDNGIETQNMGVTMVGGSEELGGICRIYGGKWMTLPKTADEELSQHLSLAPATAYNTFSWIFQLSKSSKFESWMRSEGTGAALDSMILGNLLSEGQPIIEVIPNEPQEGTPSRRNTSKTSTGESSK
ncbi:hypothetical protein PGTUg99_034051 [Puccinia graminis f. sp. tritici]|uniref:Uncharacterized protein n=1 Tax=Puccinia graminis f. sp. tritici TaxID=56615 RepID=A0A5B0NK18_PUCGR|nr:hypothetical protein PGTUg99_034051 [Puccinia graminis f. sp. tritici]